MLTPPIRAMPYPLNEKFAIVAPKRPQVNGKPLTLNGKSVLLAPRGVFRSLFAVLLFTEFQPCRCLCRLSLQITRTTRLRRMILQSRQILFTDASTFMFGPFLQVSSRPEHNAAARKVVGGELYRHFVARQDPDVVHAHLARDMAEHDVAVFELHPEGRIRQGLHDLALHLYRFFLRHFQTSPVDAARFIAIA